MATKSITVDVEAYNCLKRRKKDGESFSDVIKRLLPRPFDVDAWLASIKPASKEFIAGVEEQVRQRRDPINLRSVWDDVPGLDVEGY